MRETRQFRGISKRLAVQYLETLGGERVDADDQPAGGGGERVDVADDGGPDGAADDPTRLEGDGWTTAVSAETVNAAGSIELTEVTVEFAGEADVLEPLVEAFARKALRAGG